MATDGCFRLAASTRALTLQHHTLQRLHLHDVALLPWKPRPPGPLFGGHADVNVRSIVRERNALPHACRLQTSIPRGCKALEAGTHPQTPPPAAHVLSRTGGGIRREHRSVGRRCPGPCVKSAQGRRGWLHPCVKQVQQPHPGAERGLGAGTVKPGGSREGALGVCEAAVLIE